MFLVLATQTIENQEQLRTALEVNREQKELIKQLQKEQTSRLDGPSSETSAQQQQLLTQARVYLGKTDVTADNKKSKCLRTT